MSQGGTGAERCMDEKREAFLARLRETFRVEASEHLEAITAGLLAI